MNRDLLRSAGEHLGSLAEQERESMQLAARRLQHVPDSRYNRCAKLTRLAKELLEVANG